MYFITYIANGFNTNLKSGFRLAFVQTRNDDEKQHISPCTKRIEFNARVSQTQCDAMEYVWHGKREC